MLSSCIVMNCTLLLRNVCRGAQKRAYHPCLAVGMSASPRVPDKYCGVWKRQKEEEPPGTLVDDTTTVYWLQTPCGVYVDIRIPAGLKADDPDQLATQKSFSGRLTFEGDRTTWHRHIDFRPSSGGLDVGDNSISEDGVWLTELGVHDPYLEVWERVDNGTGTRTGADATAKVFVAMELINDADSRVGYAVVCGAHFGIAIGRKQGGSMDDVDATINTTVSKSLVQLMNDKAWSADQRKAAVSGYTCHVGRVTSSGWSVQHSLHSVPTDFSAFSPDDEIVLLSADGTAVDAPSTSTPLLAGQVLSHRQTVAGHEVPCCTHFWRIVDVVGPATFGVFTGKQ